MSEIEGVVPQDTKLTSLPEQIDPNEELRQDYNYVSKHLRVNSPVYASERSTIRFDEPQTALSHLTKDGLLIISGGKGVGKSSLLNQIAREATAGGRTPVVVDRQRLNPARMEQMILREVAKQLRDTEGNAPVISSLEDALAQLQDRNGVLLVDEYTPLLTDEPEVLERYKLLADLVDNAREKDLPVGLVIHALPDSLQIAAQRYGLSLDNSIVIPRGITPAEIDTLMRSGSAVKLGEVIRTPTRLSVDTTAPAALYDFVGGKPGVAASVVEEMYEPYVEKGSQPPAAVTGEHVESYVQKVRLWDFMGGRHPIFERVTNIGAHFLRENPAELAQFTDIFQLKKLDYGVSVADNAKFVATPAQRDIDPKLATQWKQAGLIREENGQWVIDGAITAMALAHTLLR